MSYISRRQNLTPVRGYKPSKLMLQVEALEDRTVPSTFTVLNLNNSGTGSLRQAILNANALAGDDVIDFSVSGTIKLTSGALPAVTGKVDIDGSSALGFAGTPVIAINFNRFGGLVFNSGAAGSSLRSLGIVNAVSTGITLNGGGSMLIAGNFIGVGLDGITPAGNGASGIAMNYSNDNVIGGTDEQDRNIISNNRNNGISVSTSSRNQIIGNYIGTDASGALDRGNTGNGILVWASSRSNIIDGNVISGNDVNGIYMTGYATLNSVSSNHIGLNADGDATIGNRRDGIKMENANNNLIGHIDPVTDVTYFNADSVSMQPVSSWQGIRGSDTNGQYLISGTSTSHGLLFDGTIEGVGTSYSVDFPIASTTSVYGPDNLDGDIIRLVGSYKNPDFATADVTVHGFVYEGITADLGQSAGYQTIDYPGAKYNYVHSTMGGLAVGNYDSAIDPGDVNLPLGPGHAYIYDITQSTFLTDVVYPGSESNTAYGIWHNGGTSYTICGGYSLDAQNNFDDQSQPFGQGYMVDYDSATGIFSHWTSFAYPNGTNYVTHCEGISSVEQGRYTLNADSAQSGSANPIQGSWVGVRRNTDGSFTQETWVDLNYTGVDPTTNVTSSNAVFGNQVVGLVAGEGGTVSYQATVNVAFQLSNVISGNGGNGISLYQANNNQIAMNYIGTDSTGTIDFGNVGNGILIVACSSGNMIGGDVAGGNDPTAAVFVRPPQGNLISGNNANGVLISGNATRNVLSGNFVGTDESGSVGLGNTLDGVAIVGAHGNSLIGCTIQDSPFVYYNVISGNGNNGLRITNSNHTTIQANFFGIGADNDTAVGNNLNGVLVEGSSAYTTMGGPIPLGNVVAANEQSGIVVRGTASYFISYNTFCGLAAFSTNPDLGNGLDGMLITATGGNILIRTNVITRNGDDGIEISGAARGVRVVGNIIGLDTNGNEAMGNVNDGVSVAGTAHDIVIGGPQPTFNIIPHNVISANFGNGVAIEGKAYNVHISHSYMGTDLVGETALGNAEAGIYLGSGTKTISIGNTDPDFITVISGNMGNGIEMRGTSGNTVIGSLIGTDVLGILPLPNGGNGVFISNSSNNLIGRTTSSNDGTTGGPANLIAFNAADGVFIESGIRNAIRANSIDSNALLGIHLGQGANNNQAAPVLTYAVARPLGMEVAGSLTSIKNSTFTIEFFANDLSEPSGRYLIGSQKVKTNASGFVSFNFFGTLPPGSAHFITATATDGSNNTSEFSDEAVL